MRSTGFWTRILLVPIVVGLTVSGPGCASTKNVMNKATFGLVGSEDEASAEQKHADKEQEKAEKQAAKEQKKAEKQAKKEEESGRGFMSKATFGMVGGDSEEKAAKKEAKRQAEEQKKAEKRAAKEQKKAEKQAREDEKRMAKSQAEPSTSAEEPKRGFVNKATFGLVGGDADDKAAKKEAKRQAEAEKKAEKQAAKEQKQAEKQARKDEEQMAKAEPAAETEAAPERGFMSKATFGLVGGDSEEKAAKKEAKQAAKEQEKAEKQARKVEKQAAKAQEDAAKESESADAPKRSLMSKLTFGLVGNGETEEAVAGTVEDEMPVSTPEPPVAMAGGDSAGDVQPASAMSGEFQKLARLDFETEVSYDSTSASGKPQAVASRVTYSKHGYGITDLGDVRIAVRDMTFPGGTRGGRVIISSEDRAQASGTAGIGNEAFTFDYAKGVTACTFGTIQFTIATGVIVIDGQSVPMGQGHKLVVVDSNGSVEGVYAIE
ncbi:MAG: hypothetical protein KJ060_05660 [Candidatus Hydrogenedentes bacterium]|nr:hypothetical protein [Candidatus Hydrogenedentota bacterium]